MLNALLSRKDFRMQKRFCRGLPVYAGDGINRQSGSISKIAAISAPFSLNLRPLKINSNFSCVNPKNVETLIAVFLSDFSRLREYRTSFDFASFFLIISTLYLFFCSAESAENSHLAA